MSMMQLEQAKRLLKNGEYLEAYRILLKQYSLLPTPVRASLKPYMRRLKIVREVALELAERDPQGERKTLSGLKHVLYEAVEKAIQALEDREKEETEQIDLVNESIQPDFEAGEDED